MSDRPFRALCPEADLRDAMTDDEFWDHVFPNQALDFGVDPDDDLGLITFQSTPCRVCGETGPCGYDAEGRVLIHAVEREDANE